jgi:hypothetical protein
VEAPRSEQGRFKASPRGKRLVDHDGGLVGGLLVSGHATRPRFSGTDSASVVPLVPPAYDAAVNSVFGKQRLTPSQARTVADRRRADAGALQSLKRNQHANGAMYLGGIAVESLLKALLLEKYPWLQRHAAGTPDRRQRQLLDVCYRWHDLEAALEYLPELAARLEAANPRLLQELKKLCAQWTIHIRYSTYQATHAESGDFLNRVKELVPWLR